MTDRPLPLAGLRVLDLGIITAGAATSAILADAGAEVIKIESARYPDPFRAWSAATAGGTEATSPVFEFTNRNKLGIGVDLKTEAGRQIFLDLVVEADIVVENFRRGVMESLGIGWESLRARNPSLVMASISSQGETGPDREYVSYGSTLEATGGLAALTGYAGGPPVITGRHVNYPDQIVSIFAMGMIVAAVLNAKRTGDGARLDISQRDVTTFLLSETVAAVTAAAGGKGGPSLRRGNEHPSGGARACAKTIDGRWIALEVPRGADVDFDVAVRKASALTMEEALVWAESAGISAAPALNGASVLRIARGEAGKPAVGCALAQDPGGRLVKGFPFQSRRTPFAIRNRAPALGADTETVLCRALRIPPDLLRRLKESGVIGATQ